MFLSAPLLDAGMTVKSALERLRLYPGLPQTVLRRQKDLEVFWYVYSTFELLREIQLQDESQTLEQALEHTPLGFHEYTSTEARQVDKIDSAEGVFQGVILDGNQVVGVAIPDPVARGAADEDGELEGSEFVPESSGGGMSPESAVESTAGPARRTGATRRGATRAAPPKPVPAGVAEELGRGGMGVVYRSGGPRMRPRVTGTAEPVEPPKPFEAHPFLEAPQIVAPKQQFDLVIGLSRAAVEGVHGGPISVSLPSGIQVFDLEAHVVADGFKAPTGWRRILKVSRQDPDSARVRVALVAPDTQQDVVLSSLIVHFSYQGSPCGMAWRNIAVRRPAAHAAAGSGSWVEGEASPSTLLVAEQGPAADLTVCISKPDGNFSGGRFCWTFQSPHAVELPVESLPMDLGTDAGSFAKLCVDTIHQSDGSALIENVLEGQGQIIADKMPTEFWSILRKISNHAGGTRKVPTVLLLSEESQVPWELALVDPPLDSRKPPYLGAQVSLGRWILGRPGPPLPPARRVEVKEMAVVTGDYASDSGLRPLPNAVAEGKALQKRYGAIALTAQEADVKALLDGSLKKNDQVVAVESIHFACHGQADPSRPEYNYILLNKGRPLSHLLFRAPKVGKTAKPFLFLNACQVGQSGELLGDYSGFAGSSLRAGFRGFVAPLWSVNDVIAEKIALRFYELVFESPTSVGEAMRKLRAGYKTGTPAPPISTYLAYVYYGHPELILQKG